MPRRSRINDRQVYARPDKFSCGLFEKRVQLRRIAKMKYSIVAGVLLLDGSVAATSIYIAGG